MMIVKTAIRGRKHYGVTCTPPQARVDVPGVVKVEHEGGAVLGLELLVHRA